MPKYRLLRQWFGAPKPGAFPRLLEEGTLVELPEGERARADLFISAAEYDTHVPPPNTTIPPQNVRASHNVEHGLQDEAGDDGTDDGTEGPGPLAENGEPQSLADRAFDAIRKKKAGGLDRMDADKQPQPKRASDNPV